MGASRAIFWSFGGCLGAVLENIDKRRGVPYLRPSSWAPNVASLGALGALLGTPGAALGRSWALVGMSWSYLGSLWVSLGALLGPLGAVLRLQKPIGSEKMRGHSSLSFFWYLKDLSLLTASLGGSVATWTRLGAVLWPLGGIFEAIFGYLTPSWILEVIVGVLGHLAAVLGPKGPCDTSRPHRPDPGGWG